MTNATRADETGGADRRAAALMEAIARYAVPEPAAERLWEQVEHLRRWKELGDKDTPTQRARALREVAARAAELRAAVGALWFHDRFSLDNEVFAELLALSIPAELLDIGGGVAPRIETAAQALAHAIPDAGKKGRTNSTDDQIAFIRCIAIALRRSDIVPDRKGAFPKLARAVHDAAGIVWSERAFAAYMKERDREQATRIQAVKALAAAEAERREEGGAPRAEPSSAALFRAQMEGLGNPQVEPRSKE
jgi:hypothetical protein